MTTTLNEREKQFKNECKLINLKYEYEGYIGKEKWAIVSELSETELMEKYAEEIKPYIPFVLLSVAQGEVIAEANRCDNKFRMRAKLYQDGYDVGDENFEAYHKELITDTLFDDVVLSMEIQQLREAIGKLKPIQKERLQKYFFEGKTFREIAEEEAVSVSKVYNSVNAAVTNLKKFLI